MIAVTFALPAESSDLARSVDKSQVAIVHTGVGPEIAARKIDIFLQAQRPKFVISSGFAGALNEDLGVGDLILAENFSHRGLLYRASELLAAHEARTAKLFSSTEIADSEQQRDEIRRKYGADAVDMESSAIAAACDKRGIGMLSLRVITDTPQQPLPAPPALLFDITRQRTRFVSLLGHCLTHPAAIPRLMRFSRSVGFARAELTSALLTLLREQHVLFGSSSA